ncbi:hypothetical protein KC356_g188 [Hortaea werneckii]|nr:hypothetical protein KC356_g188 [Hortaea werneckii]
MRLTGSFIPTVSALAALVFPTVMGECKHPNDPCIKENEGKTRCVCGDSTNKRQLTCNGKKWKPNGGCHRSALKVSQSFGILDQSLAYILLFRCACVE